MEGIFQTHLKEEYMLAWRGHRVNREYECSWTEMPLCREAPGRYHTVTVVREPILRETKMIGEMVLPHSEQFQRTQRCQRETEFQTLSDSNSTAVGKIVCKSRGELSVTRSI